MDAKVDYLSFTLPLDLRRADRTHHEGTQTVTRDEHDQYAQSVIADELAQLGMDDFLEILASSKYSDMGGRQRYGRFVHWRKNNVSILWGGAADNVLVELSGVSCQLLRDRTALDSTMGAISNRVTRVDVAVDFLTDVTPREFVAQKSGKRFKITEQHDTETGETQVAGSRKSERFAVVYVYQAPHPRAGVMRVEHRLRGDYAKVIAPAIVSDGLPLQVAKLGNTFGWKHALWQPDQVTDSKLRATRADKSDAGTLRWLLKSVAPALVKAHQNGLIDVIEFIRDNVVDKLENE